MGALNTGMHLNEKKKKKSPLWEILGWVPWDHFSKAI